ncbi:hypothetical protein HK096_007658 [Nowakowskiella sp. JEL0078]|nr:hypothetical protein HK096_007658 [Nowakowskiella sp. JEL0078]
MSKLSPRPSLTNSTLSPSVNSLSAFTPTNPIVPGNISISPDGIGCGIAASSTSGVSFQQPVTRILERITYLQKQLKDKEGEIGFNKPIAKLKVEKSTLEEQQLGVEGSPSHNENNNVILDVYKKIAKQCLDFKRLVDKESPITLENIVCKNSTKRYRPSQMFEVSMNIKKTSKNMEITQLITTCILSLITQPCANPVSPQSLTSRKKQPQGAEQFLLNTNYLVKRKATVAVLTGLQLASIEWEHEVSESGPQNGVSKFDEVIFNVLSLLLKLSKSDAKIPFLARLYNCVDITIDTLKRWRALWEVSGDQVNTVAKMMITGFQALKLFAKNG